MPFPARTLYVILAVEDGALGSLLLLLPSLQLAVRLLLAQQPLISLEPQVQTNSPFLLEAPFPCGILSQGHFLTTLSQFYEFPVDDDSVIFHLSLLRA